ncbi:hypothetical protein M409DRAFT_25077 [Zasmidium cellare ATCC 36951]|uniref:BTB domain-containing protein n=1 Tax=Zasmidium cellare ATCC 36951 TaxID=1080233 RepID=A0A6A6CD75_ZASCE|nr:uncharacterized protein M409DRAFT_25077 [Zasmidium cellare ATCC 36951]KAF2164683.1 hypothetical protein M409DRAFT_25077 [Zasmidium cellare ATCC 36951]
MAAGTGTKSWAELVRTRERARTPTYTFRTAARNSGGSMSLPSTPDLKPTGNDYDEIIRIKVGTGASSNCKTFDIHKGILKFYSGYFRAAISNIENGRFAESGDGVICLAEDQPHTFDKFKSWLYTRDVGSVVEEGDCNESDCSWKILCQLWCFGDQSWILLLQNEVLSTLHRRIARRNFTPTVELGYVYDNTGPQSALRRYMIHAVAMKFNEPKEVLEYDDRFTKEILLDLVAALLPKPTRINSLEFSRIDLCE